MKMSMPSRARGNSTENNPTLIAFIFLALFFGFLSFGIAFGASPFLSIGIVAAALGVYLFFVSPLALLSLLLVVRMSVDYFGDTISLPITDSVSVTLAQVIGIGVFLLGVATIAVRREAIRGNWGIAALVIFFLWILLSFTISIDPLSSQGTAREAMRFFGIMAIFLLSISSVRSLHQYKNILYAIFLSSVIPAAVGLYQFFAGIGYTDSAFDVPRIFATFAHPNVLSLYLFSLIVCAVLFFSVFATGRGEKIFAAMLGTAYSILLLLTYTRIAWVAVFVFFLVIGTSSYRKILLPLAAASILFFAIPTVSDRITEAFALTPDSSVAWRMELWKDTARVTISQGRGWFGYGVGTFSTVAAALRGENLGSTEPHSDFVRFFVEGGILGEAVFLFFLGFVGWKLWRRFSCASPSSHERTVYLILFAFFIALTTAGFTDHVITNTPVQWILWTLIGTTLSVFPLTKKQLNK